MVDFERVFSTLVKVLLSQWGQSMLAGSVPRRFRGVASWVL